MPTISRNQNGKSRSAPRLTYFVEAREMIVHRTVHIKTTLPVMLQVRKSRASLRKSHGILLKRCDGLYKREAMATRNITAISYL